MNEQRIGILALQETHLANQHLQSIENLFQRRLLVLHSGDPDNPGASAGVAFVLNRAVLKVNDATLTTLIPGRAIALTLKWHNNKTLNILNVYAPNQRTLHPDFWQLITTKWHEHNLATPDFMLGDFNLVEDGIDRSPVRTDNEDAVTALQDLREALNLHDAWRHTHPTERLYTFRCMRNNQRRLSRLDRIYTRPALASEVYEWAISSNAIPSDHDMVLVRYAPKNATQVGKGRWQMPLHLINDQIYMKEITALGIALHRAMLEINPQDRTTENTRQTLWKEYKENIIQIGAKRAKRTSGKMETKIYLLNQDAEQLRNHPDFDTNENLRISEAILMTEIKHLEKKKRGTQSITSKAQWTSQGETISKYWSKVNKAKSPRDVIHRLRVATALPPHPIPLPDVNQAETAPATQQNSATPTDSATSGASNNNPDGPPPNPPMPPSNTAETPIPPRYETNSKRMAAMAGTYHNELQNMPSVRTQTPTEALANETHVINSLPPNQLLENSGNTTLSLLITKEEVANALKTAKKGTATGVDGCPYELWTTLDNMYKDLVKENKPGFDIIGTLTMVYNDIQEFGVDASSDFSLGWMCPIYKKNSRDEIANYRPITCLNADYKLLTKALATQLAAVVAPLLHDDQAGFVPGRSIFNHVRLTKAIINFAEATMQDGAIMALDQEKAYDKIKHEYLWKVLAKFNLPQQFINTTRSLYETARTQVMVNGYFSEPYMVTRGVRQGDPLSCLLFDLAIEPLACMFRNSANLKGFNIPGLRDKLVINLFADDTILYLSVDDREADVAELLSLWCAASGAKFNDNKKEIVPIGSLNHRKRVLRDRTLHPADTTRIPDAIHIADEGAAIRSLGAWVGNNISNATPWAPVIDKIKTNLHLWSLGHPTLRAKKKIIQMIVGGMTQYLTKVQGMPPAIENTITKIIRNFMWDDTDGTPPIALKQLYRPETEGGLDLLDIAARNEAIEITWLKGYLDLTPSRPAWAFITDILINNAVPLVMTITQMNQFLQKWQAPTQGANADTLPRDVISMLKTAKKYHVNFEALKLTRNLKMQMPAWHHIGSFRRRNGEEAKCLQSTHQVKTIADLIKVEYRLTHEVHGRNHFARRNCACEHCRNDREKGCENPHKCALEAAGCINALNDKMSVRNEQLPDGLTLTHHRRANNTIAHASNSAITFDPSVTCRTDLSECFRVFTDFTGSWGDPATRLAYPALGANMEDETLTVYTDGSCLNNGKNDAQCGSGVWVSDTSAYNRSIRIPGPDQSNQVGELAAIIIALQGIPNFIPVNFVTDSRHVINGLTIHLKNWEDQGWIGIINAAFFQSAAFQLRRRTAWTTFRWVKGHSGILGNEKSDGEAYKGATKNAPDDLDLAIDPHFRLTGAKLSAVTQANAYKAIKAQTYQKNRPGAVERLDVARTAIHEETGTWETDATLWRSCLHPDIARNIQQFLYRALHKTQKDGDYWDHIPGYDDRTMCTACNDPLESLSHILIDCQTDARVTIWGLAQDLWPHGPTSWPTISLGLILASGRLTAKKNGADLPDDGNTNHEKTDRGASRLLRILVSESAHLVWVLRCERVMQTRTHTNEEIRTRWTRKINDRLTIDRTLGSKSTKKYKRNTLTRATWTGTLKDEDTLPDNWAKAREVLVGIRPPRSPA